MRIFCGSRPEPLEPGGIRGDEERSRAELTDAVLDHAVQAVDDGGHRDHAGDADDDAEDGQRRSGPCATAACPARPAGSL